jgi:hypothetical protein
MNAGDVYYDIAVVISYRISRASFALAESFPPDRRFD